MMNTIHNLNVLCMPANVVYAAATYALSSVICTIIGASVMRHSDPDAYDILWSARIGAVGGAILAIPLMLFGVLLEYVIQGSSKAELKAWVSTVGQLALGAASSTGTAALGCKILILSLGAEKVKQGVKESAIAGGVGAAVWIGAGLALMIVLSIVMCGCGGCAVLWVWSTHREVVADANAAEDVPMMRL